MTRVVVTGFDAEGTSTVVRDEQLPRRPGGLLFDVWGYDDGPVSIPGGIGDGRDFGTHFPPPNGLRVYSAGAFQSGFLLIVGWAVLTAFLIALTRETYCRQGG